MKPLKLTLVQADLRWRDADANRRLLDGMLRNADRLGDLVALPEMFSSGFTMDAAGVAESMSGECVGWMKTSAAALGVTLTGSLVIRDRGRFFNRLIWMRPDGSHGHYDKRHLFRMADEPSHYAAGKARHIFRLGEWRICPLVCYDLRFPVFSRGADEFELLLFVANWPASRRSAWDTLLPARAVENLCYSAGVNRVGRDGDGRNYDGGSGAWNYLGQALALGGDSPGLVHAQLDGDALCRYRKKFPAHLDADRFHLDD